jgi:hypothetical protein
MEGLIMSTSRSTSISKDERRVVGWWQEYATSFSSAVAHAFLLYGDISGYAYEGVSQRRYLQAALAQTREVVAVYNRATGIQFASASMRTKALQMIEMDNAPAPAPNDPISRALGTIGPQANQNSDPFAAARQPSAALPLLEKLIRAGVDRVAIIIDFADTVAPPSDKAGDRARHRPRQQSHLPLVPAPG